MIGFMIIYTSFNPVKTKEFAELFLDWLGKHRIIGPLALAGVIFSTQIMMITALPFTIGSGFALTKAYNSTWLAITIASSACYIGLWIGTIVAFLFARYSFRDTAIKLSKKYKTLAAFDRAMA